VSGSATRDWDAETYDRVGTPQAKWATTVMDRLALAGSETVLDAGCGSGRVTAELISRVPDGRVIAVDGSASMVGQVQRVLRPQDRALVADLAELHLDEQVDAVFSGAVFHWIPDHDALFARLHAALRPGGRMEAQCGGEGNITAFHAIAAGICETAPYAEHFSGWERPWNFAGPAITAERLQRAGFADVSCGLQPAPAVPKDPRAFIATVCVNPHLDRLPPELRDPFLDDVMAAWPRPHTLDYVRLNISARRPG
jgi:trans-aconitate 2-methyltransferase